MDQDNQSDENRDEAMNGQEFGEQIEDQDSQPRTEGADQQNKSQTESTASKPEDDFGDKVKDMGDDAGKAVKDRFKL
jgi:hypothetical protein